MFVGCGLRTGLAVTNHDVVWVASTVRNCSLRATLHLFADGGVQERTQSSGVRLSMKGLYHVAAELCLVLEFVGGLYLLSVRFLSYG